MGALPYHRDTGRVLRANHGGHGPPSMNFSRQLLMGLWPPINYEKFLMKIPLALNFEPGTLNLELFRPG
ncbi:MAG: hypothetical protein A2139_02785 [Desulfobacca sp. RBG_16_60_12]|nr:MAG: hypothetical protein A2139_02785 [Desulfobacca sp. RBG_16_60_12]